VEDESRGGAAGSTGCIAAELADRAGYSG
jgi:hypothetical protein